MACGGGRLAQTQRIQPGHGQALQRALDDPAPFASTVREAAGAPELKPQLRALLRDVLARNQMQADWLQLEVTEREVMRDPATARALIASDKWVAAIDELKRVGDSGLVFALDLLEMEPIHGVHFIQGDFREDEVLHQLEDKLGERRVGLVMSDMAPNMSGVPLVDQARVMHLAELGLEFCRAHLKPDGAFLVKVFQGSDYETFLRSMRETFKTVGVRKPDASRDRSAELYLLGRILR